MPETDEARLKRIMAQLPDHCTKCGHKFEKGEGGYPFPELSIVTVQKKEGETVGSPVCPEPKEVPSVIGTTATAPNSLSEKGSEKP